MQVMSVEKAMENGEKKNDEETARARLEQICARVETACAKAERAPKGVVLIGASKTVSANELPSFLQAGLLNCGENYVQEGVGKSREPRVCFPDVKWHLIGALQSNKKARIWCRTNGKSKTRQSIGARFNPRSKKCARLPPTRSSSAS